MALLGVYVGVIPVALGMLWLPWIRRIPPSLLRGVMALTVGLLALPRDRRDAGGLRAGRRGLAGVRRRGARAARRRSSRTCCWPASPRGCAASQAPRGGRLRAARSRCSSPPASACTTSARASRSAPPTRSARSRSARSSSSASRIHNTTEGLAIVAPVAHLRPSLRRLAVLGLLAGAPAVLGAWIGAAAFNASLAAFLFGFGAGAIVQVIVQLAPSLRDEHGRMLHPMRGHRPACRDGADVRDRAVGERLMSLAGSEL